MQCGKHQCRAQNSYQPLKKNWKEKLECLFWVGRRCRHETRPNIFLKCVTLRSHPQQNPQATAVLRHKAKRTGSFVPADQAFSTCLLRYRGSFSVLGFVNQALEIIWLDPIGHTVLDHCGSTTQGMLPEHKTAPPTIHTVKTVRIDHGFDQNKLIRWRHKAVTSLSRATSCAFAQYKWYHIDSKATVSSYIKHAHTWFRSC